MLSYPRYEFRPPLPILWRRNLSNSFFKTSSKTRDNKYNAAKVWCAILMSNYSSLCASILIYGDNFICIQCDCSFIITWFFPIYYTKTVTFPKNHHTISHYGNYLLMKYRLQPPPQLISGKGRLDAYDPGAYRW